VGHVVHYGASGVQQVDTLIFMFVWDRYRFDKMYVTTHYVKLVFLHPVGSAGQVVHFCASGA
jgi:hypothetical protein